MTNRDVDPFEREIDDPVFEPHVEAEPRVLRRQRAEVRSHAREPVGDRRAYGEHAGDPGATRGGLRPLDLTQDPKTARVVALSGRGHGHPSRRAEDELRFDLRLEGCDLTAHCGGRANTYSGDPR